MRAVLACCVFALSVVCGAGGAIAAVGWNTDPPMATLRGQHGGALAPDGSVVVFNGVNGTGFVTTGERYAAGAWASLGATGITGNVTNAVTLGTGQVLVQADGSLTARLFDPFAGSWQSTGTMDAGRTLPTLTLLANGQVLIAGGSNLNTAQLYDPATRAWSATGAMSVVRRAHVAALLRDGRVLAASGFNAGGEIPSAELYDPATGTWSAAAPPLVPRHYATLTLLADGRALLAGGFTAAGATPHAEIYDPVSNTWTATGAMAWQRNGHVARLLPSGQVLVAGGADTGRNVQSEAELYDPTTGLWSSAGTMPVAAENSTATLLPNGDVAVAGGFRLTPGTTFFNAFQRFTPAVPPGPAPAIDPLPLLQRSGVALDLSGTGFTGAGGASTPVLQLQRVFDGELTELTPATHSATSLSSAALGVLPAGWYLVRVVVDGVPSEARLVQFTSPPGTPGGASGNGQVTVTWTAPVNDGGNPPVGYTVTSTPASAGCTVAAPATACTVMGLANGTTYTFTVQPQHIAGAGFTSAVSLPVVPLAAPVAATVVAVPGLSPAAMVLLVLVVAGAAGFRRRSLCS